MTAPSIGRRPRWAPPPELARIDWSHPLAAGLDSYVLPRGRFVFDLVTRKLPDAVEAAPAVSANPGTMGLMQDLGNTAAFWSLSAKPYVPPPFSVFGWVVNSGAIFRGFVSYGGNGSGGKGWSLGTDASTTRLGITLGGVNGYMVNTNSLPSDIVEVTIGAVVAPGTMTGYVNGSNVGSVGIGTPGTPPSAGLGIGANHNGTGTAGQWSRPIGLVAVWRDRLLTGAEVAQLHADPFQMLRY